MLQSKPDSTHATAELTSTPGPCTSVFSSRREQSGPPEPQSQPGGVPPARRPVPPGYRRGRRVHVLPVLARFSAMRRSTCNGSWPHKHGRDGQAHRLTGAAMDKPEPVGHPLWRNRVSEPLPRSRQPARIDWMAISRPLEVCAEERQRDLLLPLARRLTGERAALSPTLDWAGTRVPIGL